MKIALSILCLVAFLFHRPLHAADEPPAAINAHYAWCGEGRTNREKLQRYEGFWKDRLPANPDEYDDHPHITFVRRCAYRLVTLYAQSGQTEKCLKTLKWLELNDETFPENVK